MGYSFLFVIIFTILIILYIFKDIKKKKYKKYKVEFFITFISFTLIAFTLYLYKSNYWVGTNILEKISNNINIIKLNNIDPRSILNMISLLENELEKKPNDINIIKKIAKAKYLMRDFSGALVSYQYGRKIDSSDFELLLGEANTRYFLEENTVSKKTIQLFEEILIVNPENIIALIIIADYYRELKKIELAKEYYKKLLELLDENSLEYKEVLKKYNKLENLNEN